MAKLPALTAALARVDGRERPTIDHIARVIREAGYIPTTKRGGGAAEMTVREAANLLIALNGADVPKEGPLAIDRFRSLQQFALIGRGTPAMLQIEKYDNYPQPIKDVMDARNFGDALERLIDGAPEMMMAFRQYLDDAYGKDRFDLMGAFNLDLCNLIVEFRRYWVKIEMFVMNGSTRRTEFSVKYIRDEDRSEQGFYGRDDNDRKISVTIGMPTLIEAWKALYVEASPNS